MMAKSHRIFASFLTKRALDAAFVDVLFQIKETYELAHLQPRIYHEETFQLQGRKGTLAHDAFSSDFARYLSSGTCKEPIPRLLDLQYVVRCNLDHGQKVLPDEWPAMKERNESIFKLTVPIQRRLAELLFENLWADGVFVYGTCKPDEGNFVHLSPLVNEYSDGWDVEGYLYDLGSYPGFVEKLGYKTKGFVLKTNSLAALLRRMDELEGNQFARKLLFARHHSASAAPLLTWVYCYTGHRQNVPRYQHEIWRSQSHSTSGGQ